MGGLEWRTVSLIHVFHMFQGRVFPRARESETLRNNVLQDIYI